jgi:hypothetical protein
VATSYNISNSNAQFKIISGKLPSGLTLSSTGVISGIPDPVLDTTRNSFVVRATTDTFIRDQTFSIDISGKSPPVWITSSTYLPVGPFGESYAVNYQYINYQLIADPVNAPTNTTISYFIDKNSGILPPGLTLSSTGIISGFINDSLTFDSQFSTTGGYDDESYDRYSFDHYSTSTTTNITIGVPKIYNFKVLATDGSATTSTKFKIVVVNPDMIINPDAVDYLPPGLIQTNTNYIAPLQFVNGSNLGAVRANNNADLDVSAYDPYPSIGEISYSITTSTDIKTNLPPELKLDTKTGHIYGYIPYQPAYALEYLLTINATKTYLDLSITSTNTFSLSVKGDIESTIEWVTDSNLGSLEAGFISELFLEAKQLTSTYTVKYQLTNGDLPPGLTLQRDGTISGAISYGHAGTYTFTVEASDVYGLSSIERSFTLIATQSSDIEYTKIYTKPFFNISSREKYKEFISNEFTFDPTLMYRYFDPNFGVQNDIKLYLEFGIQKVDLKLFQTALRETFYEKRFYFGDFKTAIAKDSLGNILYEVVYIDLRDDQTNSLGVGGEHVFYSNENVYYTNSIDNMRTQFSQIVLFDYTYININDDLLPKFMKTAQGSDYKSIGYIGVIPLCYALPGNGSKIISRIKLSGFDFKLLDFQIDRLIIESSEDNMTPKYLRFDRNIITEVIPDDNLLYGPDGVLIDFSN